MNLDTSLILVLYSINTVLYFHLFLKWLISLHRFKFFTVKTMKYIKKVAFSIFATLALSTSLSHAAESNDLENIEVSNSDKGTSAEELAAIYVLSELCPQLGYQNSASFKAGYASLVKEYLPNEQNPLGALNRKAKQQDFQNYLIEARKDADQAGDAQNKAICKEITTINYQQ